MHFLVNYFSYRYMNTWEYIHCYTESFPSSTAVKCMIMWNQIYQCLVGCGIWSGKLLYSFQSAREMQGDHVVCHSDLLLLPELCISQMLGAHGICDDWAEGISNFLIRLDYFLNLKYWFNLHTIGKLSQNLAF